MLLPSLTENNTREGDRDSQRQRRPSESKERNTTLKPMSFFSIPPRDITVPRDHKCLSKTQDTPFIGFLLSKASGGVIYESFDPLGYYSYNFEKPADGMKNTSQISKKTLRRFFREKFFGFRSALTQTGIGTCGYELRIKECPVRLPNSRMGQDLESFGKTILRPFTAQEDPLLLKLKDVPLYSWLDDSEEERVNLPFCPIDGTGISLLNASIRTPRSRWDGLCGREWGIRLCGDCLGVLGSLPVYLKQS